jgi:IMP dehydrogenase
MAFIYDEPSRTFGEYLLVPNLTTRECVPSNVNLVAPVVRFKADPAQGLPDPRKSPLTVNVPITSALMQSVSGAELAIALARCGGLSFIFGSQSIEDEAAMVRQVKNYKAGFVVSDSNLRPESTLADVLDITDRTGHSTIAITENGQPTGRLVGIVTSRDYRIGHTPLSTPVRELMTPYASLHCGRVGLDLEGCNALIWKHKLNCLPVVDEEQRLHYFVFRKDYDGHKEHPLENVDREKRLIAGAGINSRDYRERIPALVEAGANVLCIDSSDGYSEWQKDVITFVRETYGDKAYVGAGNVVDREGFLYLVECGADFVKVGIGGGSICITREQKGIGRGQASAVIEVAKARDEYFQKTGIYVPICSDGGISQDYHVTLALAMGADFVMSRYLARFDEAPGRKLRVNNQFVKEYWGEGSNRARNWQRYDHGGEQSQKKKDQLEFEEGVDSYVPYAGKLKDNLNTTLAKVRSTMCNCGALDLRQLYQRSRLTVASAVSIHEGGAHDVILKDARAVPAEA